MAVTNLIPGMCACSAAKVIKDVMIKHDELVNQNKAMTKLYQEKKDQLKDLEEQLRLN